MCRVQLLYISVFILGISLSFATDYCSLCSNYPSLCPNCEIHIACGKNEEFDLTYPGDAEIIDLKPYQAMITDYHNSKRNLIASGGLKGYKSATRMATMQWDDELAYIATLNRKERPDFEGGCYSTDKFKQPELSVIGWDYEGSECHQNDTWAVSNAIGNMWNGLAVCKMEQLQNWPGGGTYSKFFATWVIENNIRVGCAGSRVFQESKNKYDISIVCLYSTGPKVDQRVYADGPAASGCKTGRNPQYTSLCSTAEEYDV